MPRDIFREVGGNGDAHRKGGQWYTVPLSMLTHAVLIVTFIAVPLLMTDALPTPASVLVFAAPPLPPKAEVPSPTARPATEPRVEPSAPSVPTEAPVGFTPEAPPVMKALVDGLIDGFKAASDGFSALAGPPPPVAKPPAPAGPIRPGGVIKAPSRMHDVPPTYPAIAKAAHVQGTVVIEATIAKDGSVRDARVVSGPELLTDAALSAVRQWRYTPSLLNGDPVEVLMTVTVRFTLQ